MNTLATHRAATRTKMAFGLIAGCLLGALSIAEANAAALGQAPSVVVKYDEQSLSTESGALALYRQLEFAARKVCPDTSGVNLHAIALSRRCQQEALDRAVRQINNPRLAAVYASSRRNG
jgi:UrcA family protein